MRLSEFAPASSLNVYSNLMTQPNGKDAAQFIQKVACNNNSNDELFANIAFGSLRLLSVRVGCRKCK